VPGAPVTDRASETLSGQELAHAAADKAQNDIVPTAADEHAIGIEHAERHTHSADTLHAMGTQPAPAQSAPPPSAARPENPADIVLDGTVAEQISRPPRPKPKGPAGGPGVERSKGRTLGH
jgi:hypothetical protein